MDNGKREFEELRNILQKLDRSLDEAQQKRTHGSTPPVPMPGHNPSYHSSHLQSPTANGAQNPTIPAVPAAPAIRPDTTEEPHEQADQSGRLKAKPLRRPRPENSGPSHGWVH